MYQCYTCGHLDKTRKKKSKVCYNYGCNARNGYTCGWVRTDGELKLQGCSDWVDKNALIPKQVSLFD